ncbi:MAG: hypothetical protein ACUVWP_05845 [bacterium]
MEESIMDIKNEADPIVVRFRSLIELLRYITIFYIIYLALFIPLFGIIVGYIMKKNGVLPETRKIGNIALIIGIIEIILFFVCIIVYVFIIAAGFMGLLNEFQQLENLTY